MVSVVLLVEPVTARLPALSDTEAARVTGLAELLVKATLAPLRAVKALEAMEAMQDIKRQAKNVRDKILKIRSTTP